MKKLKAFGDEYEAEQIVNNEGEVTGYIGGRQAFRFAGIRDMNQLELLDGAEWDESPSSEWEIMKKRQEASESAILSLMDMSLMGGI